MFCSFQVHRNKCGYLAFLFSLADQIMCHLCFIRHTGSALHCGMQIIILQQTAVCEFNPLSIQTELIECVKQSKDECDELYSCIQC